jgi:type IV secretory pathway TrbL component
MLLGFIGTGIRVFPQLFGEVANPSAFTVQLIMTLLCLIFVILAVKSFIDARRNREN